MTTQYGRRGRFDDLGSGRRKALRDRGAEQPASVERVPPGVASWLVPGASSPEPAVAHVVPLCRFGSWFERFPCRRRPSRIATANRVAVPALRRVSVSVIEGACLDVRGSGGRAGVRRREPIAVAAMTYWVNPYSLGVDQPGGARMVLHGGAGSGAGAEDGDPVDAVRSRANVEVAVVQGRGGRRRVVARGGRPETAAREVPGVGMQAAAGARRPARGRDRAAPERGSQRG